MPFNTGTDGSGEGNTIQLKEHTQYNVQIVDDYHGIFQLILHITSFFTNFI
jgi:hypothetical protein